MGTLARAGIFDGKKVDLRKRAETTAVRTEKLSAFDKKLLSASDLLLISDRIGQSEPLTVEEVTTILDRASLPLLLKLVNLYSLPGPELEEIPTIFLPVDTWLDRLDPAAVIKRAVGQLRRQTRESKRVLLEVKDFSDIEHLWPEIIDELRSHVPEEAEFVGPNPQVLMDWINANDMTESRAVRRYQFQQKLSGLREAGFDSLNATTHCALLAEVGNVGFPIAVATEVDPVSGNDDLARRLVRVTQQIGKGPIDIFSWMPTLRARRADTLPQAAIDLLLIRAHLIGALVYPGVLQIADGASLSVAGIDFLRSSGISALLFVTADPHTASSGFCQYHAGSEGAHIISGSF